MAAKKAKSSSTLKHIGSRLSAKTRQESLGMFYQTLRTTSPKRCKECFNNLNPRTYSTRAFHLKRSLLILTAGIILLLQAAPSFGAPRHRNIKTDLSNPRHISLQCEQRMGQILRILQVANNVVREYAQRTHVRRHAVHAPEELRDIHSTVVTMICRLSKGGKVFGSKTDDIQTGFQSVVHLLQQLLNEKGLAYTSQEQAGCSNVPVFHGKSLRRRIGSDLYQLTQSFRNRCTLV